MKHSKLKKGRGFVVSLAQRQKAREEPCVATGMTAEGGYNVDPAHLVSRAQGGCDDPLCVVPLVRPIHRQFDDGEYDLLPRLVKRRVPELQHALGHYNGDVYALLRRLTGERWYPESEYRKAVA